MHAGAAWRALVVTLAGCAQGDGASSTPDLGPDAGRPAVATFTLATPIIASTGPGSSPLLLAAADLDRDGRPDVAFACSFDNALGLLVHEAGGALVGPTLVAGFGVTPYGIAAADFDGDGHLDLAVSSYDAPVTAVYRGPA